MIYDGGSLNSPLLAVVCGKVKNVMYRATNQTMMVRLVTTSFRRQNATGFEGYFRSTISKSKAWFPLIKLVVSRSVLIGTYLKLCDVIN